MPKPKLLQRGPLQPRTTFPRVRVRRTSTATYTAATVDNLINWESSIFDSGGMWDPSDPSKILCRLTGEVEVEYALEMTQTPVQTVLRLNGDATAFLDYTAAKSVSRGPLRVNVRSGDYLQLLVDANAGSDTVLSVNSAANPRLVVSYVSRGM